MNTRKLTLAISVAALSIPSLTLADNFYVIAQVGTSIQNSDSTPIGSNIAVDADFPAEFSVDNGTVGAIGIGYRVNNNLRVEGRIGYRDGDFNDTKFGTGARSGEEYILNGSIESTTYTLEGFYDFTNTTAFTPYIKLGVGVSDNTYVARLGGAGVAAFDEFDGSVDGYYDAYSDDSSTNFTWNVGIGGNYEVSKSVSLYAEYQYASFGDVQTGQDSFTDGFEIDNAASHEVVAGIRFSF